MTPIDPVHLTRRLVDIESTTYNEGAVGVFLADYLRERGFAVETTPVPQPPWSACSGVRLNVYAAGQIEPPDVVLSTHMDTVPPYIASSEDADNIYGRGSCDAKGIIAAQIAAAEQLRERGVRVGLLFVVGEERDSAGAKIANEHPKGSSFLINGEPTDNRLALASKGALRVAIEAQGRMAHSAYPELGESATAKLVHALERILAVPLPVVADVGPSTLNIGLIEGGHAPNVIADQASAQLLVRLVGDSEATRAAIVAAAAPDAEVSFPLEIPFMRLRAVHGLPTMIAAFTTDVPALTAWGEPLLLGPGSIHVAHTPHERLAKRELCEAIELYVRVACQLVAQGCGGPESTGQEPSGQKWKGQQRRGQQSTSPDSTSQEPTGEKHGAPSGEELPGDSPTGGQSASGQSASAQPASGQSASAQPAGGQPLGGQLPGGEPGRDERAV